MDKQMMEAATFAAANGYYSLAAKYVAVGMACLGMGLVALAVSNIFTTYLSGAFRNPCAASAHKTEVLIFAVIAESLGLFLLLVVMLLLFVI
ncbi:ATPase [Candidatus Liberibacter asiaticus]|uniref:ATP synthase F(0) sector subunit c n=2 Tax=Liberibacter asiaticus TaxID=34021 RepID=C6XGQ7_LIBAP|nr:ATPase [Candidatus Liberibacter asiaticus]ACT57560.1 H+transporting two-sector ATPase C subunit [Candidatus Liberibacter asiaticus str. psy62]AGH17323.1 H+transporting two-sector ATPase C subunit [Candidatus Liberibacter asiaticus str. gxpsy]ALK07608.1 ATPase [Candidatus Liberibacter asiaticus]ASK53099.1 ATPase [Candidatus Liberibacter asiaticus]AWL14424.1 ATPase [Candidatus Liberibacter asiaticus]